MIKYTYERDKQAVDMVHMKNTSLHRHLDYYSKEYQLDTLWRRLLLNALAVADQPLLDSTSLNNTNYYFAQFVQHTKMLDLAIVNSNFEILKKLSIKIGSFSVEFYLAMEMILYIPEVDLILLVLV